MGKTLRKLKRRGSKKTPDAERAQLHTKLQQIRSWIESGTAVEFTSREDLDLILSSNALTGLVVHMTTLHDDNCSPLRCACTPTFVLELLTEDALTRAKNGSDLWNNKGMN